MNKLIGKFIVKRRTLIFNEVDLIKALNTINQHDGRLNNLNRNMTVANCGWTDRRKWFIHFDASDKTWESIRDELKVIRVWETTDIPKDSIGQFYTTD